MSQHQGVASFENLLETGAELGFFELLLPFLLSYAIFYLALQQVQLFNDQDQYAALVAIIGSFFVAEFIRRNEWYQTFFTDYFAQIAIGMIAILGLYILMTLAGFDLDYAQGPGLAIVIVAIVGAAFITAGGFGPPRNLELAFLDIDVGRLLFEEGLIWLIIIAGSLLWLSRDTSDNGDGDGNGSSFAEKLEWFIGSTDNDGDSG